ncbi:spatacsin isoform 2-T2 [Pholidichthys leucotaenia]
MLQGQSIAVALIPENPHCGAVGDIQKAQLAPGGSLLGCLRAPGSLEVWNTADRDAPPATVDGCYRDFSWEEAPALLQVPSSLRLVAVSSQFDMKLLEVRYQPLAIISVLRACQWPADHLLKTVREQDSVAELQSVQLLTSAASRCCLLLNADWLLQLRWRQGEEEEGEEDEETRTISCFRVQPKGGDASVSHCVAAETLFVLSSAGLVSVFNMIDGVLLAHIDLTAYVASDPTRDHLSSFCLLQVSPDLSTAVAVTRSHTAVAVNLDHYFRVNPDHLLCAAPRSQPPLRPESLGDQDSLTTSRYSLGALGSSFRTDCSWKARLASMYSRAQQPSSSSSSSSSWTSSLPHLEFPPAPSWARSRVPPGGLTVSFSVPTSSSLSPSLLSVSGFSALLTLVAPGNTHTTLALWEMESGRVSYHRSEGEEAAAPIQLCGERQCRLLLKKSGLVQVLFSVSQQDLINRLMLFSSAATVDAVCHLNSWGRCSIPIHALQAGLKNRQLDTVDFYLKSKDNALSPSHVSGLDQPATSTQSLTDSVLELCPALDLLCSAVRDSMSEAESRQFSEQLLNITITFINTQIRSLLSSPHHKNPDVQSCVNILDRYVIKLRSYMERFPWPARTGGSVISTADAEQDDVWEQLPTEEVVLQSILTNQIPRAQAVLWRLRRPEHRLSALRKEGLRQVFCCLQRRDLKTANTLLTNMGFNVKKQLLNICLHTDNKDLRELMVEELSSRSFFPEEEVQSMEFIRELEELGSKPPLRGSQKPSSVRLVGLVLKEGGNEEALMEAVELRGPQEEQSGGLWRRLRLDWVRNWDQNSRTNIVLSRLRHTELSSCDASVLWRYLTALHDQNQVVDWIENGGYTSGTRWPELTPELVNDDTVCSGYMREDVLDRLARRGAFVPEELSDLERLLWRLAQGGGVMAASPPVPQYRSPLGLHLHTTFISFCLERGLRYLLYSYLEHYRLTPRNCPLLSAQNLSESQPWFEMMVRIQEITRDLTDPGLVFQAVLTSAQVLLPGSQASLNSLLSEGHSLLALGAITFTPGGIDQVMAQGKRLGRSEGTVDPQLLKMALAPHPKLKAALFPSGPRGSGPASDISVYHLLQSLHPLDPSRLFGWQAANTLNSTETSELPHFSSPHLVSRFALVENLDFLYYLHHGRPSFAYATFLVQHLSGSGDVKLLLQRASQQVYNLALRYFNVPSVASAIVCFCELLGVCSLKLRVDIRVMNTVLQHWNQQNTETAPTQHLHTLVSKGVKLVEAEPGVAEELIGYLETAVTDNLEQRGVNSSSYEAAQEWALPVQFCQLHCLKLSSVYPAHCARDGQFIHFLLFVQLHRFPPQQVRSLVAQFGPTLQAHLSLAFQALQLYSPRRSLDSPEEGQQEPVGSDTTEEEKEGGPECPRELFQVLLQSQEETVPCRYLLQEALVQHCPTLAVLAACVQGAELVLCLCVWVLTSVDAVSSHEATSHLANAPQHHEWTLHDLSIIWKTLLSRGLVRPLLRGFQLFQKDCPLVLVLSMFELCCDYRDFSEAKTKLLDFQRTVVTLRQGGPAQSGHLPLQWVESQASVLLLTMLQRCSSQYDLHRLLLLLVDVDKFLKSNYLDFRKLSQLSQLLQGTNISISPRLLQCTSPSVQQEELQATVDALQDGGYYSQARQVALLAGLPVHRLLLTQLLQEVNSQKSKRQWGQLETRVSFWRKCHDQLQADSTDPESTSHFFLSQSEPRPAHSPEAPEDLLDLQERCLLLVLAAHWLSRLSLAPLDQLESLEKQLWLYRVYMRILKTTVEEESVFNLPQPAITPEMNSYEVLMKEFSFSNITDLNTEWCLSLEGLPGPSKESMLKPEERGVLVTLIDQLLDEGSVHEAGRVCRYFSLHHPDVWVVLRCRGLASGDLNPEPEGEGPEDPTRTSVTASPSLSSLSSLVMLPMPDDKITIELQKLVDRCRHGSNYCKQVLSLYQLSKELQCSFSDVCREEPCTVLEKLLLSEQPERFRKARAFAKSQGLHGDAVAELVSSAVVRALLSSTQELQPAEKQVFRPSEGRDSLVQLIKLCDDPNLVGLRLLENLNSVPLRDLNCIVELLIVAHDCFSLTCNMEGIVRVLQAARHLSHTYLAPGQHHSLLEPPHKRDFSGTFSG